ncbi:serine/threonine-protein kinase [uncultured Jatrophihabitans sp.]|uniref:serine/threonine-protein kinase n=1 Tax=uncultured Jatrophihabitans sp. TaxID=1610747 RepID=UPI0035CA95D0
MDVCTERLVGGRYRLQTLLGRGGMADVYRAHDPVRAHDVALKVFRPHAELIDTERRRHHEVDMLAALHHPGVVRLLDADVTAHSAAPFIAFELVDGPTLRAHIAQGTLDQHAVAALGTRLARTLDHVHRRGIVHRDVKPPNILLPSGLDPEHGAKLTDFGIARVVDSTRMTGEGLTVGTAGYLSPEQVTSDPIGTASDVYARAADDPRRPGSTTGPDLDGHDGPATPGSPERAKGGRSIGDGG